MNFQKFTGHENLHFSRPEEVTDQFPATSNLRQILLKLYNHLEDLTKFSDTKSNIPDHNIKLKDL